MRWQILARYDTRDQCAEVLYFKRQQGDAMARTDPAAREFANYFQCVSDDDPRLPGERPPR